MLWFTGSVCARGKLGTQDSHGRGQRAKAKSRMYAGMLNGYDSVLSVDKGCVLEAQWLLSAAAAAGCVP